MIPADLYRYSPEQRQALADDPTTSPALLRQLAGDSLTWIKVSGASNPSTPEDVLCDLAHTGDMLLRLMIAENPSTPSELLDELSLTDDPDILFALLPPPHTSDSVARSLGKRLHHIEQARG